MKTIQLEVTDRTAEAFERASADERRRLQEMLELALLEREGAARALDRLLLSIRDDARARGMTDEVLADVLRSGAKDDPT